MSICRVRTRAIFRQPSHAGCALDSRLDEILVFASLRRTGCAGGNDRPLRFDKKHFRNLIAGNYA